jgi:phenol 2-monooxygenase
MRGADSRPVEIQDLLPSDARFKLLVFTGDSSCPSQLETIGKVEEELESILTELTSGHIFEFFDILSVSSATKATVRYNDLPALLRWHWSKVLIDDTDVTGTRGGNGYMNYGIGTDGVVVVVRPDGYVGMVTALGSLTHISTYFKPFLRVNKCV